MNIPQLAKAIRQNVVRTENLTLNSVIETLNSSHAVKQDIFTTAPTYIPKGLQQFTEVNREQLDEDRSPRENTVCLTRFVSSTKNGTAILQWGKAKTIFGHTLICWSTQGIHAVSLTEHKNAGQWLEQLQKLFHHELRENKQEAQKLANLVFTSNRIMGPPIKLSVLATDFQLEVWKKLLQIPSKHLVSYGAIARKLGHSHASRAVANAIAANPVALLIPCHRVIRTDGKLGGYRWGANWKAALIIGEQQMQKRISQ